LTPLSVVSSVEAVLAIGIIVLGGIVEGFGYGLSLGTSWPYTRTMPALFKKLDPEVWHRIFATGLGLGSLGLLIYRPGILEITGFALVVLTALLGAVTLYTLSGRAPSIVPGIHDVLAYLTMVTYLLIGTGYGGSLTSYLLTAIPFHSFFLVVLLGGMTTGQRGFQKAIGDFVVPRTKAQVVWVAHALSVLLFVLTLAYYVQAYNVALILVLVQMCVGVLTFMSVNRTPMRPGALVMIHQIVAILIALSIFFSWYVVLPLLG
jgi:hypothetical protein